MRDVLSVPMRLYMYKPLRIAFKETHKINQTLKKGFISKIIREHLQTHKQPPKPQNKATEHQKHQKRTAVFEAKVLGSA